MEIIEPEFAASTWQAFRRVMIDGEPDSALDACILGKNLLSRMVYSDVAVLLACFSLIVVWQKDANQK